MTLSKTQITPARTLAALATAGMLLAVPATGLAKMRHDTSKGKGKAARCANPHSVGFAVGGTLVSVTPDDPATPASEATVTLTLTGANRHARKSGDIVDQDPAKKGVQPKGFVFTVPAGDAYSLRLRGYEGTDTPSVGDKVRVRGRIAVTKPRCAAPGTSVADRYGAIDVRRVTIGDRDPD
jgi:hypothetical protein